MNGRTSLIGAGCGAAVALTWIVFGFWSAVLLVVLAGIGAAAATVLSGTDAGAVLEKLRNR